MAVDLSTYGGTQRPLGYAGDLVDENSSEVMSMSNSGATAIVPGTVVAADASGVHSGKGATCKAVAADGDVILGIAKRFPIAPAAYVTDVVSFAQYASVPVIRKGDVYITAAENVTAEDAAISITAGHGTIGGTTGGAAGTGRVAIPNAKWLTTTTSGSLGIVHINV